MRINANLMEDSKRLERFMEMLVHYRRDGSLMRAYNGVAYDERTRRATRYNLVRRVREIGVGELLDIEG